MSDELEHFKSKYRATISKGNRRYTVSEPMIFKPFDANEKISLDPIKIDYGIQIEMSKQNFDKLVQMESYFYRMLARTDFFNRESLAETIIKEYENENLIRLENNSVRAAYEKYQSLLQMVKSHYR